MTTALFSYPRDYEGEKCKEEVFSLGASVNCERVGICRYSIKKTGPELMDKGDKGLKPHK